MVSSAGDAALSVGEPGRLSTVLHARAAAARARAAEGLATAPVANDVVPLSFTQAIGADEALRTGIYSTTLTFTLSTTNP